MKTAILFGILVGLAGCATAPTPVVVEQPGNLSASYHSVAVAPVHHDAPPELGQVVDTDEDAPAPVVPHATEVTPDVTPKNAHGF